MILIYTFRLIISLPGGKIKWNDAQKFTQQDIDDFNKLMFSFANMLDENGLF